MGTMSPEMGGGPIGGTLLTDPRPGHRCADARGRGPHPGPGLAQGATLVGTRTKLPCNKDARDTYTCAITSAAGRARVYWNPYHQGQVTGAGPGAAALHLVVSIHPPVRKGTQ